MKRKETNALQRLKKDKSYRDKVTNQLVLSKSQKPKSKVTYVHSVSLRSVI